MPMPLSATASSTQSRPSVTLRTRSATSPSFVNLQALLRRLSRTCLSRMESAVSAPRLSCASTTRRFLFFSASCPPVPMTSSISRAKLIGSGLSSSLPASILERSSISLMRLRRWVPAAFTRRRGSSAFSVPKRAALLTIISVRPMMALSGVRSSWLMLARNCDLRSLASASCRLLSWIFIEQTHVLDRDSGLVGKGHHQLNLPVCECPHRVSCQSDNAYWRSLPQHWNAKQGTKPTSVAELERIGVFWISQNVGNVNNSSFEQNASRNRASVNSKDELQRTRRARVKVRSSLQNNKLRLSVDR